MIILGKGGEVQDKEIMCYKLEMIKIVMTFKYNGILLQTTGMVFTVHVEEKLLVVRVKLDIKNLSKLSLEMTLTFF
jgi:hypothetical protein